jgi:hypothetical protein
MRTLPKASEGYVEGASQLKSKTWLEGSRMRNSQMPPAEESFAILS